MLERVFAWPGMGNYAITALMTRIPAIQSFAVVVAAYVVVNLLVDLTYRFLDPRIRVG